MATFHPNPNEQYESWIERRAITGLAFRNWHIILFCFMGFLSLVIFVCCCIKLRVPRTKQEIEANYRRKKLVEKFRERVRLIENHVMDTIDLQKALEIIQEDYKTEAKYIDEMNFGCNDSNNLIQEEEQPVETTNNGLSLFGKIMRFKRRAQLASAAIE